MSVQGNNEENENRIRIWLLNKNIPLVNYFNLSQFYKSLLFKLLFVPTSRVSPAQIVTLYNSLNQVECYNGNPSTGATDLNNIQNMKEFFSQSTDDSNLPYLYKF